MLCAAAAAGSEHARITELLLAFGASADPCSINGWTPLLGAAMNGRVGAVRTLLAHGAVPQLRGGVGGNTALHVAAASGHRHILPLLCAAPGAFAAVALRNNSGETPFDVSVRHGAFPESLRAFAREAALAAECVRVAAASAAERAEAEARFASACAAAKDGAAPTPWRGPAADSPLGERFLGVISIACANGHGLDLRTARRPCRRDRRLPVGGHLP